MEIFLSKSESERFRIGNELNSFGRKVLESSLRNEHPGLSEIDLKIAVFKRCYAPFYSPEEFDRGFNPKRVGGNFILSDPAASIQV